MDPHVLNHLETSVFYQYSRYILSCLVLFLDTFITIAQKEIIGKVFTKAESSEISLFFLGEKSKSRF